MRSGLGLLAWLGLAVCVAVPDGSAHPAQRLDLSGGFFPDPQLMSAEVAAGTPASDLVRGCPGFIGAEPALVVGLDTPSVPLRLYASGDGLAGLLVVTPDGIHHCATAAAPGFASLRLGREQAGEHSLFPVLAEPSGGSTVQLAVSELDLAEPDVFGQSVGPVATLDPTAPPAAGRHSLADVVPLELPLMLAGGTGAEQVAPGCNGLIAVERPDLVIALAEDEPRLALRVRSASDTTLVVREPAGELHCDDDSYGHDPAVVIDGAAAGDYAVWVGVYSGPGGDAATLVVARDAEGAIAEAPALDINPLLGQQFSTAAEAFAILMADPALDGWLTYARLEEEGAEALSLHDVVLRNPVDATQSLAIARIRISELDLEGLATEAGPARYALAIDGIDYAGLVAGATAFGVEQLPELDRPVTLSIAHSVLPTDSDRQAVSLQFQLDGQLGFAVRVVGQPVPNGEPFGAMNTSDMEAELVELQLQNFGFLQTLFATQAAEQGVAVDEFVRDGLSGLAELLEPIEPGGPKASLYAAVEALLGDLDGPGTLRLVVVADAPQPFESLFTALLAEAGSADPGVHFSAEYNPTP